MLRLTIQMNLSNNSKHKLKKVADKQQKRINAGILIGQQDMSCSFYWLTKEKQTYEPPCLLYDVQV